MFWSMYKKGLKVCQGYNLKGFFVFLYQATQFILHLVGNGDPLKISEY